MFLFYFVSENFSRYNPNVFLNFKYTSDNYYKILINDSLIIDSEGIKLLKFSNEHYETKTLYLELPKGNYSVKIKDEGDGILSQANFKVDYERQKYIYLGKEIIITDKPFILI